MACGHRLMHSRPVDLYACEHCGSLFRDPATAAPDLVAQYRADEYGEHELVRLHRGATAACDRDRQWLAAHGIAAGRRILEVGCYAGGLLAVGRAAGCRALGIDVGIEMSEFDREIGLDVITGELEAGMLTPRSFDAVFILNCLEQLPRPRAQFEEVRRLLRPGGELIVRTPNAVFVRRAHCARYRAVASRSGVLGAPFVRCWSPQALSRMLRSERYEPVAVRGLHGPWMEVAARAA